VEILAGFPQRVTGRLVFMPQDNLNTDAIYGKDYTYRDDMTPEMMAKVVMENYDPQFAARTKAGDVIVSQFNFGTGSSREQAVTCLKAKGIPLVIAASICATLLITDSCALKYRNSWPGWGSSLRVRLRRSKRRLSPGKRLISTLLRAPFRGGERSSCFRRWGVCRSRW